MKSKPELPDGFVSLKSLKQPPAADPNAILADIRHIYFNTTAQTIEHDWAHAIELLKKLPSEEHRERATVFMHGLDEMRRQWEGKRARKSQKTTATRGKKATR